LKLSKRSARWVPNLPDEEMKRSDCQKELEGKFTAVIFAEALWR
jgi:hypothetical protein